jgi:Glycosyl transferase 4-like domain
VRDDGDLHPPGATPPALLCISPSFTPATTPTAIRAGKLLENLAARWRITVLSETEQQPQPDREVQVESVRSWRPARVIAALRRLRLDRLLELLVWPDESIFWVAPAILAGRRLIRDRKPSAIVVFMMPYSAGLVGIALSRLSDLPLVLNLDDSPTCTDMHPHFPTRLHHRLARALEDFYVKHADAIVYVSQTNLDAVRARQDPQSADKLHIVRYGADPRQSPASPRAEADVRAAPNPEFEIAYVGAMSGWWALIEHGTRPGLARRLYAAWNRLGRHELVALDHRTSSPAVIGRAIIAAIAEHRDWAGRIRMVAYGNPYAPEVVERALTAAGIEDVVSVFDPVAHEQVAAIVDRADLLFITLPTRLDGSRGGRISAKTYEYLATDRPILAAVPRGENWDYLTEKPGVWLVAPDDQQAMQKVLTELVAAKLSGSPLTFDRLSLAEEMSYATRAREFSRVIDLALEHRDQRAG